MKAHLPKLSEEYVPFEGGPMDGQAHVYRTPLRPHIYWRNKNGTFEVYVLEASIYGYTYKHQPGAETTPPLP